MNWRVMQGDAKAIPLPDEHVEARECQDCGYRFSTDERRRENDRVRDDDGG